MRSSRPLSLACLVVAAACGGAPSEARPDARPGVAPSTTAVADSPRAFRTVLLPPPPTTSTIPLPIPAALPWDSYAPEAVVELGTVEIPRIGLRHRMYQGVTMHNIDLGPSHWPGTALPGQYGNTVVAGHRVTHGQPFRHLDRLVSGDEVIFDVGGVRSVYRVTETMIVEPNDTWIGDQAPGFTGTLYTCHPPGSAAYRYVVRLALDPTV